MEAENWVTQRKNCGGKEQQSADGYQLKSTNPFVLTKRRYMYLNVYELEEVSLSTQGLSTQIRFISFEHYKKFYYLKVINCYLNRR